MYRTFVAISSALLLASPSAAQDDNRVLLRWFGHSFFQIESPGGARIVFDPHAIDEYGLPKVSADYALISHPHEDHNQPAALANRQDVKVVHAVTGEGRRATWESVDVEFKDVKISTLPPAAGTYHDREEGAKRGKNGIFIVEVAGLRIVHLGDLGHTLSDRQIKALGPVDVLMIPVGGIYTINGSDAQEVLDQIKPKRYVIPMHFGTKVYQFLPTDEEFLLGLEHIKDLRKTNVLVIDPDEKPGDEPEVVRLGWEK